MQTKNEIVHAQKTLEETLARHDKLKAILEEKQAVVTARRSSVALEIVEGADAALVAENLGRHERELSALQAGMELAEKQVSAARQALEDLEQSAGIELVTGLVRSSEEKSAAVYKEIAKMLNELRVDLENTSTQAREIFNNLPVPFSKLDITQNKKMFYVLHELNNGIRHMNLSQIAGEFATAYREK